MAARPSGSGKVEPTHGCAIYFETPFEPGLLPMYYSGVSVLAPIASDEVCHKILRAWSRRPWRDEFAGPLTDRMSEIGFDREADVVRKHASAKGWYSEEVKPGALEGLAVSLAAHLRGMLDVPVSVVGARLPLNRSRRWVRRQVEQWTRNLTELFGDFGMAKPVRHFPSVAALHNGHAEAYRAALAEHTQAILQGLLAPATITFGGTYEDPPIPF